VSNHPFTSKEKPDVQDVNSTISDKSDSSINEGTSPASFNGTQISLEPYGGPTEVNEVDSYTVDDVETISPIINSSSEELNITLYNETKDTSLESFQMAVDAISTFNTNVIIGISVVVVVIAIIVGIIGFVIYRHSIWNRPQTLSDKFSNDESTGYIDDTAFRENSEELYSLDNDSFLNSLEAMTIQNYWTDHVKHTKL